MTRTGGKERREQLVAEAIKLFGQRGYDSATLDAARTDVETYVISDRMAQQLAEVVLPNLRFDAPGSNKGIFIVGTYGTEHEALEVVRQVAPAHGWPAAGELALGQHQRPAADASIRPRR